MCSLVLPIWIVYRYIILIFNEYDMGNHCTCISKLVEGKVGEASVIISLLGGIMRCEVEKLN